MNKKIEGNLPEKLDKAIKQKQYTILCGDIIEDTHMISKEKLAKTLTIGFLNYKIEENIKFYNENYDVVLTEEDACFQEVEEIIKKGERCIK